MRRTDPAREPTRSSGMWPAYYEIYLSDEHCPMPGVHRHSDHDQLRDDECRETDGYHVNEVGIERDQRSVHNDRA